MHARRLDGEKEEFIVVRVGGPATFQAEREELRKLKRFPVKRREAKMGGAKEQPADLHLASGHVLE
jgi:hypothetical protein